MARYFKNPYTGSVYDLDSMPGHSLKNQRPGIWCPATDMPLDAVALANYDLSGMHTPEAKTSAYNAAAAKVAEVAAQLADPAGINSAIEAALAP